VRSFKTWRLTVQFGLTLLPEHATWDQVLAVARAADEMEIFESAWTGDHFYPTGGGDTDGPRFEAWTLITAVAQATSRLRVGVLVSGMLYRHPAVVANMAATIDAIAHGRLEIGLGAGWSPLEIAAYGMDKDLGTMTDRFDRFEEGLVVIDSLLTQEITNFQGKYYQMTSARCEPKPLQRPRPPFVLGGIGEKRTLPLAARFADHWNFPAIHGDGNLAALKKAHAVLAAECDKIGRDVTEIRVSTTIRARDGLAVIAEQAEMFRGAGVDLLVIAPAGHDPADLEVVAKAIKPLG
jgi:F420-dependent oxidoreductase-like protein